MNHKKPITFDNDNKYNNDNDEFQRLRIENKRLKKIISDIRNLVNYELDDDNNLVDDLLNEIDKNEQLQRDTNTTNDTPSTTTKGEQKPQQNPMAETIEQPTNIKNEEGSGDTKVDGAAAEKQDNFRINVKGKGIFDAFLKKFDNKQPEYAKELMYFSRTVKEYPNLTLKQAQDTYFKYGKGGFEYISDEEEKKRIEDEIQRPIMFEKLLEITRKRDKE